MSVNMKLIISFNKQMPFEVIFCSAAVMHAAFLGVTII